MITKSEIEKAIEGQGNFIKIDKLNRFLKEAKSTDVKVFIFLKLADAYEKANMQQESAKMYHNAAISSITFKDKIKYFILEAKMHVGAGNFNDADGALKKALGEANSSQREDILSEVKDFYKHQGEVYEKGLKRGHAIRVYEHLAGMRLSESERTEVKEKLLELYDKTGNIRKAKLLKGID